MIRAPVVKYDVAYHDQELLSPSCESPGERVLTGHVNESFSYPLPELFLRGPELIVVRANYSSVLLDFHAMPSS